MKTPIVGLHPSRQIRSSACLAFSVVELIVTIIVAVVLVSILMPEMGHSNIKGTQTKSLAQAKQVALALKLYAGDHNGVYPTGTNLRGETIRSSNDAFRSLFPQYTQSEKIFGNKQSAWQTSPPDDLIDLGDGPSLETLKPGENVCAYMEGLSEVANPACPLIADGTDGTGHYTTEATARGGVWKGVKAIVIRLDNSGALENLRGPDNARYVAFTNDLQRNLLDAASYKDAPLRLLDPAAAPAKPQRN